MSLDKAIQHGKEHRKTYYGSKAVDHNRLTTIDAVEVVRCKDCEYYENEECVNPYIWMSDGAHLWPDEDFYCAKGEWRSEP